jgi:hypothetical protein
LRSHAGGKFFEVLFIESLARVGSGLPIRRMPELTPNAWASAC